RQRVMRVLDTILHAGRIYQLDMVNAECYCTLVIGSFEWYDAQGPRSNLTLSQNHIAVLNHVHGGQGAHVDAVRGEDQFDVDRAVASEVLGSARPRFDLVLEPMAHQPEAFGIAYFPITLVGGERIVLRLLVDLREKHAFFSQIAMLVSILGTLVVWVITGTFLYRGRHFDTAQQKATAKAVYLAEYDGLTGVYNRNGYERFGAQMLSKAEAQGQIVRLILLDLAGFTEINDFHGYTVGDTVLCAFAEQLKTVFGAEALVARLGGDEFAVLEILDPEQVGENVRIAGLDLILPGAQKLLDVRASAGMAFFPRDADNCDALTQAAHLAQRTNQHNRQETVIAYTPEMNAAFRRRLEEIDAARDALEMGQLVPHYQPLVDAVTGEVEGLEALLRWNHPTRGVLPPSALAAALEDRLILPRITQCMLDRIVKDIKFWHTQDLPYFSVGLNISEADLRLPHFAEYLKNKVNAAGIPMEQITLEVTERAISDGTRHELLPRLDAIRASGASLALDDFGTGHSSITLLKEIPATSVKIDKSFISNIVDNAPDLAIVRHLVPLAHELGYLVVAEGIETDAQRDLLSRLGVDLLQGWLFSKAVPADQIADLVSDLSTRHAARIAREA
ncbi:MAG: bifunctional diguanylate cyclase/phosphodiesterase, partial [Pseudomonadota bacterium]